LLQAARAEKEPGSSKATVTSDAAAMSHAVVHMHTNLIIPDEVTAGGHGIGADWVSQLHTNANKWEAHTRAELGTEELHRRKRRLWVTHD
jgi:hypothetical protein